ncbi:transmembrane component MtsC of energizing module of methionine-regulated ECF transporter [Lachnospiraceae bacterium KM106-2]|nr:transmembrane component MtsC of energizing module of methionine-regulated ECF transporter [Lachnospiraceae bacterium KM106-2]
MSSALSYIEKDSFIHKMTGTTKLVFFLFWSLAAMLTYDTRILTAMFIFGVILFRFSKLEWREIKVAVYFIVVLMVVNMVGIYLFGPEQGVIIYKTRHELFHIAGPYYVVEEQLFYMLNFALKYFAVIPVALIFILVTNPSEFASSLNKIGVSYRIGYAVSIALRYIPDVQRDYHEISQAQQARGIDLSKKDGLMARMKNSAAILFPLVLSSIQRIETISNAMELRGFGKNKKRTWIVQKSFQKRDYVAMLFAALVFVGTISVTILNGSRYWNPFL